MPTISEEQLSAWTSPAFNNEDEKRQNTERMIQEAIRSHDLLRQLGVDVYAKGSYKNNTNVRRDSDVDIAVEYTGIIFSDYEPGTNQDEVRTVQGLVPYSGPFRDAQGNTQIDQFKDAVGAALVGAFGQGAVTRRNKVFEVHESGRSLQADVVPCTTYRYYWSSRGFNEGIRLLPDRPPGWYIHSYPRQHYENGVAFNERASRRFKRVVRILKNLENRMVADGAIEPVPSYLIECLAHNAPTAAFAASTWAQRVRDVLFHVWDDTKDVECEKRWLEVNGIKYLFHARQKWSRAQARDFVHDAWQSVKDS